MIIAKQMEVRSNLKKYFDLAFNGETVIVPRKQDKNVVIISEAEYNRLSRMQRLSAYAQRFSEMEAEEHAKEESISDDHIRNLPEGKFKEGASTMKQHNLVKLNRIRSMKDERNRDGTPGFSVVLINRLREIIRNLIIQPEIFANVPCSVQFEYDNSRGDHMEIEIGDAEMADVFVVDVAGKESSEKISVSAEAINARVVAFYG